MYDSLNRKVEVVADGPGGCGSVVVQHHLYGAHRDLPEHYRVIAGPGACDITPVALDELIADLQVLQKLTRQEAPDGC